jgi:RNA polymerase sigma-70 factor (family 1)
MYTVFDKDERLVAALRKGDRSAFTILYDRYWDEVYTMIYSRLQDEEAAKDIVQNIFVNLWLSRKDIYVEQNLGAYLNTAARNRAYSFHNQNQATFARDSKFQEQQVQYTLENRMEADELESLLEQEIDKMPHTMREVFILSRKNNKTVYEIANELNLSEQTIKNNITLALERLRKKLKVYYSDPVNISLILFFVLTKI